MASDLLGALRRTRDAVTPTSNRRPPAPYEGEVERVTTSFGDVWMRGDDEVMLPMVRSTGTWEREEGALLLSLASPGCRFLDVGANVGYFSALMARAVPDAVIIAIEPEPRNLGLLRLNLWEHAPQAEIWGCALTAGDRLIGLSMSDGNPGDTRSDAGGERFSMVSPGITGDDVLAGRSVDLVKIDVQGFELEVVRGLVTTLRRSPDVVLVVEFLPGAIRDRGLEPRTVLDGYRAAGLDVAAQVAGRITVADNAELLRICEDAGPEGFVNLVLRRR